MAAGGRLCAGRAVARRGWLGVEPKLGVKVPPKPPSASCSCYSHKTDSGVTAAKLNAAHLAALALRCKLQAASTAPAIV